MPPSATKSSPPSIYSNMAQMATRPGASAKPGLGATGPGGDGGGGEEKKQIVTTLTSVLKKWEELEKDPKGKEIIQQMAEAVKKYQAEILKDGSAPNSAAGAGGPGGAEPPPDMTGGGAGAGAGGDKGEKVPA
jgi:hypothetical protein